MGGKNPQKVLADGHRLSKRARRSTGATINPAIGCSVAEMFGRFPEFPFPFVLSILLLRFGYSMAVNSEAREVVSSGVIRSG